MKPSSRTPEGETNFCPICRHDVIIEPSSTGDATCPFCGHLLWFQQPDFVESESGLRSRRESIPTTRSRVWDPWDLKAWNTSTALAAILVSVLDQSLIHGMIWLSFGVLFGRQAMPRITEFVRSIYARHETLLLGVVIGWALCPGPLVGPALGAILAAGSEGNISSLAGAFLGLIIGPIGAAIEGIIVAPIFIGLFSLLYRLWSGRWAPW